MIIQLDGYKDVANPGQDGVSYLFRFFQLQDNQIEVPEKRSIDRFRVTVGCSRTLAAMWNLGEKNLQKVLYWYAREKLCKKIKEGFSGDQIIKDLHSGNSPRECPYDPALIKFPNPDPFSLK